jgi:hypothetical protein
MRMRMRLRNTGFFCHTWQPDICCLPAGTLTQAQKLVIFKNQHNVENRVGGVCEYQGRGYEPKNLPIFGPLNRRFNPHKMLVNTSAAWHGTGNGK